MVMLDRMTDLQGRVGQSACAALRWWVGELASMVPISIRRRITSLRSRLILEIAETGARLVSLAGHQRDPLGAVDLEAPRSVHSLLAIASGARDLIEDVALSLPPERALKTAFALPLAAERNLDQVIGFEFERIVPFKRDEAYYTYRVVLRDRAARSLQIEVTVVRRADIDPIINAAGRCGLRVTSIEVASIGRPEPSAVIPLEGNHHAAPSHTKVIIGSLACLAVLLVLACISVPFLRAESALSALSAQVAAARHDAAASAALERQIETRRHDSDFLMDRRRSRPTATELFDTVTRLAPDDTWLTELRIGGDRIDLTGASASATNLLGLIDQSPSFADAAFQASITQDAGHGREHFDIAAKIVPKEAK
jgi:general secretion pathway protein L